MEKFDFKKCLKFILLGLSGLFILTFFFNFIKLAGSTNFSGFNAMFGITLEEEIEEVSTFKANPYLVLTFIFSLISIGLNLVDLKKFEPIKKIVLPILYIFNAIAVYNLTTSELIVNKMMDTTITLTVFAKIAIVIALIQFVLGIYDFATLEIKKEETKYYKIAVFGLVAICFIGLGFNFVNGGTESSHLAFSGYKVIFGGSLKETAFGVSSIDRNIYGMVGFFLGLFGLLFIALDLLKHKKIYNQLAMGFIACLTFFFGSMHLVAYEFVDETYISNLTVNGLISCILAVSALVLLARCVSVEEDKNEMHKDIVFAVLLLIIFSTYLPIYYCYKDYSSYIYGQAYYSAYDIIFTKVKFNDARATLLPIFFQYEFDLIAIVLSLLPIENKKLKDLLVFIFIGAAAVALIASAKGVFANCLDDDYAKVTLYRSGLAWTILLIASAGLYLNITAKEK